MMDAKRFLSPQAGPIRHTEKALVIGVRNSAIERKLGMWRKLCWEDGPSELDN
jgi:hypothetical protein